MTLICYQVVGTPTLSCNKGASSDSSPVCWDSNSFCRAVAFLRAEEKNSPAYKKKNHCLDYYQYIIEVLMRKGSK